MIRVDKPASKIPPDWATDAARERLNAEQQFKAARKKAAKLKFKFEVYGAGELRAVLNDLFGFKCAYCEQVYGGTQPVAIEHYRPKGEVHEGKKKLPGYYWLAAEWTNLLPSCTDSNSRRTHPYPDGPEVRGKGNEFPLIDPKKRAKKPGAEAKEKPLILDPSGAEDPAAHFEFLTGEAERGLVRPALAGAVESALGRESIRVYALDRPGLIRVRRDHATILVHQAIRTKEAAEAHQSKPADPALKKRYDDEVGMLKWHLEPGRPFLQMSRQLIATFFPGFKP
jgi:hypothetical protein